MVRLTDGHYLDQGIVMTTGPRCAASWEIAIDGTAAGTQGELCHMRKAHVPLDAEGEQIGSDAALRTWLLGHPHRLHAIGSADLPALSPRMGARCQLRGRRSRARRCGPGALLSVQPPLRRIWHLFVRERSCDAKRLPLAAQAFPGASSRSGCRNLPDASQLNLDLLARPAAGDEARRDDTLQSHILEKVRPSPRVTNAVHWARATLKLAGPWRSRRWSHLRMKVFAKLGVQGYQPYERLRVVAGPELKPFVHQAILSERYGPRALRCRSRQAGRRRGNEVTSSANHTFLLMASAGSSRAGTPGVVRTGPRRLTSRPGVRRLPWALRCGP